MGGVSVEVRPSTGMSAATSRPSTGLHSSGSHNRSSSSGGIPHSIRLPPRYVAEAARAEARMETRAVDPEAIRRAFQVWDSDDDGRIDVDDLKSFVVRTALQAPVGGWDAYLEAIQEEAGQGGPGCRGRDIYYAGNSHTRRVSSCAHHNHQIASPPALRR